MMFTKKRSASAAYTGPARAAAYGDFRPLSALREIDHGQRVGARHRRIADIGGQHQLPSMIVGKAVGPHADVELAHRGIRSRREDADRVGSPRLDEKMSWASSLTERAGHAGRPGTEKRWRRVDRIEDVDRVVGGVRHVDVAARGVDGGVVEAAVALMRRQVDVAGKSAGASRHCEPSELAAHAEPERDSDDGCRRRRGPSAVTMASPMTPPPKTETTSQPPTQHGGARSARPSAARRSGPSPGTPSVSVFVPMKA